MKIAICFAQFGPYHHARVRALQEASEATVVPLQLADATCTYAWESHVNPCDGLRTLCEGHYEKLSPLRVFFRAFRFFRHETISAALLPSYAPASETALFLAAKFAGVRCVMMNESHAGTERARGWKKWVKLRLVRRFNSALVGGTPQKRYFTQLGLPEHAIFTGYDAIDNSYFEEQAARLRSNPSGPGIQLGLPDRYFLSLGRMVKKKNLPCLLEAYACFADKMLQRADTVNIPALVFVGSGPEEDTLRRQCERLSLNLIDAVGSTPEPNSNQPPSVYFYGFRQITENPVFYSLAEAFILPSLWEEWGLVVNEAMASGLPVIVSETAGSAADLVHEGENGYTFAPTSSDALAICLEKIAANPTRRKAMAQKSNSIIQDWGCENFANNALAAVEHAMKAGK